MAQTVRPGRLTEKMEDVPASDRPSAQPGMETIVPVQGIAVGGDGVGRDPSGRVVFVPRSAPGDVVRVEIMRARSRWAHGRLQEIVEAGPGRRSPPCPRYPVCGGCQLQHLERSEQLRAKRLLVHDALRRIGRLSVTVPEPIERGSDLGYRNRVTFAVAGGGDEAVLGFRRLDAPNEVVDVRSCPLAEEPIGRVWAALRDAWDVAAEEAPVPGTRITVRGSAAGEVDVLTHGELVPSREAVERYVATVPELVGWHHVTEGGAPECLAGSSVLVDRWQGTTFDLPADVFLQVNREVSSAMDEWLDERVGPLEGRRVLDLYAGVGARAIRWARAGAEVTAVEVSERAAETCRRAVDAEGGRLDVVTDRVENRLGDLLPADLVIVNPPRAGLSGRVSDLLVSSRCDALAYVSCDPATLARDLDRLSGPWTVVEVQPFDAFPQTSHVETMAWLKPS